MAENMKFELLASSIKEISVKASNAAKRAVNQSMTLRNWAIDLVFYNRLLHCNVIIELKNDEFRHEDLGQLNAYVGYYKKHEMIEGDNPPVGILLCTDKGNEMVEYALSGMDNQLFVSTYMLHLPDKKKLKEFIVKEMKEMEK